MMPPTPTRQRDLDGDGRVKLDRPEVGFVLLRPESATSLPSRVQDLHPANAIGSIESPPVDDTSANGHTHARYAISRQPTRFNAERLDRFVDPQYAMRRLSGAHQASASRRSFWWRVGGRSWTGSLILHASAVSLLGITTIPNWWISHPGYVLTASWSETVTGRSGDASPTDAEPLSTPAVVVKSNPSEAARENFRAQVEAAVKAAETTPIENRLSELDSLADRMDQVSSAKSLGQLSARIHNWLGLQPRAAAPRNETALPTTDRSASDSYQAADPQPPARAHELDTKSRPGESTTAAEVSEIRAAIMPDFDYETAQLHAVTRTPATDASSGSPWQYEGVLLDAEGRTRHIPLSESEGAPLYQLLQRIRANPLLESLYRQLAMPLLDQLIHAEQFKQRLPASSPTKNVTTDSESASVLNEATPAD
jgi:hypothetical protein